MIIKGKWAGYYKYDSKRMQELLAVEHTDFEMDITSIDNRFFKGTVEDDEKTKGTPGIGKVSGEINGREIKFIKQMPIRAVLTLQGTWQTSNKPHLKLFYVGELSENGKSAGGTWEIKSRLAFRGITLVRIKATTGTWVMNLAE